LFFTAIAVNFFQKHVLAGRRFAAVLFFTAIAVIFFQKRRIFFTAIALNCFQNFHFLAVAASRRFLFFTAIAVNFFQKHVLAGRPSWRYFFHLDCVELFSKAAAASSRDQKILRLHYRRIIIFSSLYSLAFNTTGSTVQRHIDIFFIM